MIRHLFLSPHFDDAIGSCGGTIARLISMGHSVRILTVFGGVEREPFSMPATVLHAEWKLERPVGDRRLEDASACRVLGCETSFLEFSDAIYRQGADGRHLYPTFESLRGPLAPEDDLAAERLAAEVRGHLLDKNTVVYCPLAIGAHVDHVLVRDCCRILMKHDSIVVFYRDFYYDQQSTDGVEDLTFNRFNVTLTRDELGKKVAAFSEYKSQISDLFESHAGMTSYFERIGNIESMFLPKQTSDAHLALLRKRVTCLAPPPPAPDALGIGRARSTRPFVVSYRRWLRTHGRGHKEYEERKHYPWHVLGRVNFTPSRLPLSRQAVLSKRGDPIGALTVLKSEFQNADRRHVVDVAVEASGNTQLPSADYKLVFGARGEFITIYALGQTVAKKFLQFGPLALYGLALTPKLLAGLLSGFAEELYVLWDRTRYRRDIHTRVPRSVGSSRTTKLRIDLADGQRHWFIMQLFEHDAHRVARRCYGIPAVLTVAYVVKEDLTMHRFDADARTVLCLDEVDGIADNWRLRQRVLDLREVATPFSKFLISDS
ncbi:MAG: PIG-L family deacetylase [Acidobacteriota bacterium]